MTQSYKVVVVNGSISRASRTGALAQALVYALRPSRGTQAHHIELANLWREIGAASSRDDATPAVRAALDAIEDADLIIAASPVYKASYTGLFKHLFDLVHPDALVGRPVLLAATGGSDRHALSVDHQLRTLFAFFRALAVPSAVYGSEADFADGQIRSEALRLRVQEAAGQAAQLLDARTPRASALREAA